MIVRFKLDRNGDDDAIKATITSDAGTGALGPGGLGKRADNPPGMIDADGWLKALDGGDYTLTAARIQTDPMPPLHRLQLQKDTRILCDVPFYPVADESGVVDVLAQLRAGTVATTASANDELRRLIEDLRLLLDIGASTDGTVSTAAIRDIVAAQMVSGNSGLSFRYDRDAGTLTVTNTLLGRLANLESGVATKVNWRFDAENNVLMDGVNDTTVTLLHAEKFKGHTHSMGQVTGLSAALAGKADLSGGKLPVGQLPDGARNREFWPADEAALLKLNAYIGDVAHLAGQRYLLVEGSPALRSSWLSLDALGQVTSVNGQTGVVQLRAADVGAVPSGTTAVQLGGAASSHSHPAGDITGKESWLKGYVQAGTGISVTEVSGRLEFAVAGSGQAVAWTDITGKPGSYPATWADISGKPSSFPVSWSDVSGKPSLYPSNPANVSGFDAAARGAVDTALYSGTLTNFGKAAADAVGSRIVSDSIAVTASGNGQIRLEASGGGTGGGITLEEADGQPSLTGVQKLIIDGGELSAVDATTAKLSIKGGTGTGGEITMSYTPKYKRVATASNPLPFRSDIVCRAVVRTAFAQADGRDIRVYTDAGSVRPSNVISAIPGPNYVDYTVLWSETLDGSQQRSYEIRYGDEYAPERPLRMDELHRLVNRPTRNFNGIQLRIDPVHYYRSPNFGTPGQWTWTASGEIQELPAPLIFAGKEVHKVRHTSTSSTASATIGTTVAANSMEFMDAAGAVVGGFGLYNYGAIIQPTLSSSGSSGQFRTMHILSDGVAWDIGHRYSGGMARITLRYRHPGVWTITSFATPLNSTAARLLDYAALYAAGQSIELEAAGVAWGNPDPDDASTWAGISITTDDTAYATVGDEQVYTP